MQGKITEVTLGGVAFECPPDDSVVVLDSVTRPEKSRRIELTIWTDSETDDYEHLCQSQKRGIAIQHELSDGSIIETPFFGLEKVPNNPDKTFIVVDCRELSDEEFYKLQRAYCGYLGDLA